MDSDAYFADVLDQLQLTFITCRKYLSISALHASMNTISQFKEAICEEVNTRALPNKLPDELLIEVFKYSVSLNGPCPTIVLGQRLRETVQTGPLLRLTHVCRRWRNTALACTVLWQRIDCRNLDRLQEFTRRSSPGPLSIYYDVGRYRDNVPMPLLTIPSYADRLRRLDIMHQSDRTQAPVHQQLLSLDYPHLECLTVGNCPAGRDGPAVVVDRTHGALPRLLALAIAPVASWLPAPPLPALTHLFLSFRWGHGIRWPLIRSILVSTPALQVLHLSHYHDKDQDAHEDEGEPIPLLHLRFLVFVKMRLRRALALLHQLHVPASCRIYLDCHSHAPASAAADVFPRLPAMNDCDRLTLVTHGSQLGLVAKSPSSGLCLRLSMLSSENGGPPSRGLFTAWLSQLPGMFPLCHLSSLQLRSHLPASTITQMLQETISLTTLEVMFVFDSKAQEAGGEDFLAQLCHALGWSSDGSSSGSSDSQSQSHSILCPALHSLTIAMPCYGGSGRKITNSYPVWLSAIRSLIRARARMGHPIRRLAVQPMHSDCGSPGTFRAPADVVDSVYAQYASLGGAEQADVEEVVLYRPGQEAIAFTTWDWGEIERYWALRDDDRPSETSFCPMRK
ncbi:hypothetical protein K466DRAFT_661941 [Polyporus arcularius HHB13444]|uniref:F-box domain-containing protein n=1 Tax=Polyporus arcularius HHB13444 TaxID=1314778 RepID=A0A5C3PHB1_9APHY|nr:hypothetical protein K466DRAFT_661941 [Polyporus arcularius HHB13444]